jgi:hypothetical protein
VLSSSDEFELCYEGRRHVLRWISNLKKTKTIVDLTVAF